MNIKKALSFIAFGFMFTLIDLNLTFNGTSINVTPDFIGWILIFISLGYLGDYVSDKAYLKVVALLIAVCSAAIWLAGIVKPEINIDIFKTIMGLVEAVFMFIFFGVIENIAKDYNSTRTGTITMLKWFNICSYLIVAVVALIYSKIKIEIAAPIFLIAGLIALVCAIITMFVLFGLRKEISEKLA